MAERGGSDVFGYFDNNSSNPTVFEYMVPSNSDKGHWSLDNNGTDYKFNSGAAGNPIFVVSGGRFVCKAGSDCSSLLD